MLIGGVVADSPAAKAGLHPGDVITSYDSLPVDCRVAEELPLFNRLVLSTPVGKTVRVEALREGQARSFMLTTTVRGKAQADEVELAEWGLAGRDLTLLAAMEKRCSQKGVQVQSVRPGGPGGEAKPAIQADDVITHVGGKAVRSVAELRQSTRELLAGKGSAVPVLVAFERKDARLLTVVRVGAKPSRENPAQPSRPWLGAATQALTRDLAEALNLKEQGGVRLTQIVPGSPADRAGLKVGDILLKLDGAKIDVSRPEDVETFANLIRQYRVGSRLELDLVREGKAQKAAVTLGPAPLPADELPRWRDEHFEFTARELAQADRQAEKLPDQVRGVIVERVEHAGWAFLAHLALGDVLISVNGKPTPAVADLEKVMDEIRKQRPASVVFFVRRGIHTMFLEVEPKWENP